MINLYSITKIITIFSVLYAVLIFTVLPLFNININLINILKYATMFEVIIILMLIFSWRFIWNKIPKLNDWLFPDINGIWNVEIYWNWKQDDGEIKSGLKKGEVTIKQNFLTLSMELSTDESESETLVIQPKKNPISGNISFYYIYRNTPKGNKPDLNSHIGTAILKVSSKNDLILEGNYFTDRDTKGLLKFIKRKDNEKIKKKEL